jgi:hypothetical protein
MIKRGEILENELKKINEKIKKIKCIEKNSNIMIKNNIKTKEKEKYIIIYYFKINYSLTIIVNEEVKNNNGYCLLILEKIEKNGEKKIIQTYPGFQYPFGYIIYDFNQLKQNIEFLNTNKTELLDYSLTMPLDIEIVLNNPIFLKYLNTIRLYNLLLLNSIIFNKLKNLYETLKESILDLEIYINLKNESFQKYIKINLNSLFYLKIRLDEISLSKGGFMSELFNKNNEKIKTNKEPYFIYYQDELYWQDEFEVYKHILEMLKIFNTLEYYEAFLKLL